MNRDRLRKLMLILPSSVIFFLIVPLGSLNIGGKLDSALGLPVLDLGLPGSVSALLLMMVGGYYIVESIRVLLNEGRGIPLGDLIPSEQSNELVTTGIYSHTRNPMLFGYLLCFPAIGVLQGSISVAFIIPAVYIGAWSIWLKAKEEPALEARFGDSYREYRRKTPFLVPKLHRGS